MSLEESSLAFTSFPVLCSLAGGNAESNSGENQGTERTLAFLCAGFMSISVMASFNCSRSPWQLDGESFYQKVYSACEISQTLRQTPSQMYERLQNNSSALRSCTTWKNPTGNGYRHWFAIGLKRQWYFSPIVRIDITAQTNTKYVTQIFVLSHQSCEKSKDNFCLKKWKRM